MPRVKKNSEDKPVKKTVKKSSSPKTIKPIRKTLKPATKPTAAKAPKKKAHPVIIDVIEDDEAESFFPEFPELKHGTTVEDMAIDEANEENEENEENADEDLSESEEEKTYPAEELDQQKRFFSKLISEKTETNPEMAEDDEEENGNKRPTRKSIGLYRRLAWRFVGLTAILILIVLYFSFSKLTINISPNGEALNDSLLFKVMPEGMADNNASSTNESASSTDFRENVEGTVKEIEVSAEQNFPASGEESVGDEVSGKVTLINNSAKSQALVATTRLLSADNKLFRIK